MDDKDLFFEVAYDPAPDEEACDETEFDDQDVVDPELFYLACQKALVRLKTYAASAPSF